MIVCHLTTEINVNYVNSTYTNEIGEKVMTPMSQMIIYSLSTML